MALTDPLHASIRPNDPVINGGRIAAGCIRRMQKPARHLFTIVGMNSLQEFRARQGSRAFPDTEQPHRLGAQVHFLHRVVDFSHGKARHLNSQVHPFRRFAQRRVSLLQRIQLIANLVLTRPSAHGSLNGADQCSTGSGPVKHREIRQFPKTALVGERALIRFAQ